MGRRRVTAEVHAELAGTVKCEIPSECRKWGVLPTTWRWLALWALLGHYSVRRNGRATPHAPGHQQINDTKKSKSYYYWEEGTQSIQSLNPSWRVLKNLSLKSQQLFAKDNSDGTKSSQKFWGIKNVLFPPRRNFSFFYYSPSERDHWNTTSNTFPLPSLVFILSPIKSDYFCVVLWFETGWKHSNSVRAFSYARDSNIVKPHWPQCSVTNPALERGSIFTEDISVADLLRGWKSSSEFHGSMKVS